MTVRSLLVAFTLAAMAESAPAQEVLLVGARVSGDVAGGNSRSYVVRLGGADLVTGSITQRGQADVLIYLPDGTLLRRLPAPTADGRRDLLFAAEAAGTYRIDVAAKPSSPTHYELEIASVVAVSRRVRSEPSPILLSDSRIDALRRRMASGQNDTTSFWTEVARTGTPLVEPVGTDGKFQLVTFLWRAVFDTRNVLVVGTFQGTGSDVDNIMHRVGDSDVWYLTLKMPAGARFTYQVSPNDPLVLDGPQLSERAATAQADSLNSRRFNCAAGLSKFACLSAAELPGAAPQPWVASRPGVQEGRIEAAQIASERQKLERPLSIYTPVGYRREGPSFPLVVLFDGQSYLSSAMSIATTLNNLIGASKISAPVVVFVGNVAGRRAIDLVPNADFEQFITTELMPWIRQRYNVTADPSKTVIGGFSLGGLTAAYLALRHPATFGNVLAQSGAFWWEMGQKADDDNNPTIESNWVARQFATTPKLPLKFYLEAGTFEAPKGPDIVRILVNVRQLRDVLRAKGYDVAYQQFVGGHDPISWRGTIADGLIALLGRR